jgi:hypothetical protein
VPANLDQLAEVILEVERKEFDSDDDSEVGTSPLATVFEEVSAIEVWFCDER